MRCNGVEELMNLIDKVGQARLVGKGRNGILVTIKKENSDYIFGDETHELLCSRTTMLWLLNKMQFEIRNTEIDI